MTSLAPVGTLDGWAVSPFTAAGKTYDCYEKGAGPGVVLIPEIPGLTPEVMGFAQHLVDNGFTVVIPSPFGVPGKPGTVGYTAATALRLCVSSEFRAFAIGAHRPITDYLRAVAADLATRTPGAGVGVIGMCFTGGFALATAVDDSVLASVLSQPSAPFPTSRARRIDPGMSPSEFDRVTERTQSDGLCVLGLRFSADVASPRERFATLKTRLGDAFEVIEIDSSPGNEYGISRGAHSVLTSELRENPGSPTLAARARVVHFLTGRLTPAADPE